MNEELKILSAALLTSDRPVKSRELANFLGVPNEAVIRLLDDLKTRFLDFGFDIESVAGGYRLIVSSDIAPKLENLFSKPALPSLSPASLETLAIIAYKQPLTRSEIERFRGSAVDSSLATLQDRDLVKVVGRKEIPGKPRLFGTSEQFLLEFGLKSIEDLPPLTDEELPTGFLRG